MIGRKRRATLKPIEPMARSVQVFGSAGRLSIEVNGKPEAWLYASNRLDPPQLEPHYKRRNAGKGRMQRLLVHLCHCAYLDPTGRHCTPKAAIEAAVKALNRAKVQHALADRQAWQWLMDTERAPDVVAVETLPASYRVLRRGRPRWHPLPEFMERRLLAAWWLERARQIRERRGRLHTVGGYRRQPPRWHPDGAPPPAA